MRRLKQIALLLSISSTSLLSTVAVRADASTADPNLLIAAYSYCAMQETERRATTSRATPAEVVDAAMAACSEKRAAILRSFEATAEPLHRDGLDRDSIAMISEHMVERFDALFRASEIKRVIERRAKQP